MDAGKEDSKAQPNDPLRQQLDELEELMQCMLALSVDSSEEGQVEPGSPEATTAPAEYAPPYPEFDWANSRQEASLAAPATAGDAEAPAGVAFPTFVPMGFQAVEAPVNLTNNPWEAAANPSEVVPVAVALAPEAEAPGAVRYSLWLRPLVFVNRIYDGGTSVLGPPGRFLRSDLARNVLGICGLAGLIASAAWIVWERGDWN